MDRHPKLIRGKSLVYRGYRPKVVMPSTIHKVVYCIAMCHIIYTTLKYEYFYDNSKVEVFLFCHFVTLK